MKIVRCSSLDSFHSEILPLYRFYANQASFLGFPPSHCSIFLGYPFRRFAALLVISWELDSCISDTLLPF